MSVGEGFRYVNLTNQSFRSFFYKLFYSFVCRIKKKLTTKNNVMYQTINFYDFEKAFINHNRENQFTYLGKQELFNWLERLEDDQGDSIELDVIGLCCEFTEYESIKEFQKEYGEQYKTIKDIEDNTLIIPIITNKDKNIYSFIIQNF